MSDDDKKSVSKTGENAPAKPSRYISPFEEMENMMAQFFDRDNWMNPFRFSRPNRPEMKQPFDGRTPKVDVINRDNEIAIRAELPGVKKDDLDVTVSDDMLTIKASTKHEEEKEEGEYHRRELSTGEFRRTIQLPAGVDAAHVVASFKDGLLELTLPKKEEVKRHNIKIE